MKLSDLSLDIVKDSLDAFREGMIGRDICLSQIERVMNFEIEAAFTAGRSAEILDKTNVSLKQTFRALDSINNYLPTTRVQVRQMAADRDPLLEERDIHQDGRNMERRMIVESNGA